jgi:hypothetical protein
LASFALRLRRFSERTTKDTIFGKKKDWLAADDQLAFNELLQMNSNAYRDAPAAAGRFPVVINHPGAGGSFEDNAVLFEFLASHGYVVISSAYQTNTAHVSNNIDGPSRSIRDMQFLLQAASKLPFVEINKIAGVGHSAGAQTLMRWIGEEDCPLHAMVSLDTTIEYLPRDWPGVKQLLQALEGMQKPVIPTMLFASAERHPNFQIFDRYLQRAPKYEVTVSNLRHNDYVSQGALRAVLVDSNSTDRKNSALTMRRSYDQVCITIRYFLDAILKLDEDARAALKESSTRTISQPGLTITYRAPR